jgi:hypothetical protein
MAEKKNLIRYDFDRHQGHLQMHPERLDGVA